jgi:membrane protease YdiL (CAAX protease family)
MPETGLRPYFHQKGHCLMDEQFQEPPEEILPSSIPPSNSRSSIIIIALCWFFIIGTIVFSQLPLFKAIKTPQSDSATDLQMELMAKYIVGVNHLLGQQPDLWSRFGQALQMQKNQSLRKKLATVPILAEVSGREAALKELQQLQAERSDDSVDRELRAFTQLYRGGEVSLNPQQRLSIKKYGWIGKLALSQDKSVYDPARSAILRTAFRLVILWGIMLFGILALLAAGTVLLIVAIVFWTKGKLRSHLTMPENPGSSMLEAFAIYLTGFMALPALLLLLFPGSRVGSSLLALLAVIIAIIWPRLRGSDWKNYRAALGWNRGQGFFREIGAGILGYIAGLPLLVVAVVLVAIVSRYVGKIPSHPLFDQANPSALYLLVLGILACVWAPIVEETFFRGVLFGYFRRHASWVASGILSALLFAMVHPQGWLGAPAIGMIGFTLSAIREWRGSLIASMSAHALNNASVMVLLILILN